MRVTEGMIYKRIVNNIHSSMKRLQELQLKISTGKRITKASDDPVGSMRSLYVRTTLGELEQFKKNINDTQTVFSVVDNSLQKVIELLRESRNLAVMGANETSSGARKIISENINEIIKGMLDIANTEYSGAYLFGGSKPNSEPFVSDVREYPSHIYYRGDRSVFYTEIGINNLFPRNFPGDKIFGTEKHHTIIGKRKVFDTEKPLNQVLPGPVFPATTSFEINLEGVAPTTITIDPQTQSLKDLVNEINLQNELKNSPIVAEIDRDNRLVIKSTVSGKAGRIYIRDIDGLLTKLGIADTNGEITGENIFPESEPGIFDTLLELRDYLKNIASENDELIYLDDTEGNPLSLKEYDVISVDIDGSVQDFVIGSGVNTLSDLAKKIQEFARSTGYTTLIVEFKRGRLTFTNASGDGATDIGNITITARDSQGRPNTRFNQIMSTLGGIEANGSQTFSSIICTRNSGRNISSTITDIERNIDRVLSIVSELGTKMQRLEATENKILDLKVVTERFLSENEDVDLPQVILEFQTQQNVYQAALASAAKLIQPNLFEFLR